MVEPLLVALLSATVTGALPDQASGWRAEAAVRYDATTIFDYIDGHGEVYLAYGMRSCTARRYEGPPGEDGILLDLFEMASPADAYGVFTHGREGEPVDVGEDGVFGSGTLSFWKGTAYIALTAERPTERARAAVLALARTVADALPKGGTRPALVARLPRRDRDERSVVYLRHSNILAAHLPLGAGVDAGVGPDAPAALARYRQPGTGDAWLLLVSHPGRPAAAAARASFAAAFQKGPSITRRDDGFWGSLALDGTTSAFVVRAATKGLAADLLAAARGTKGAKP